MNEQQTGQDENSDLPTGILPPLLLARYKRDLTYRQSREQKYSEQWGSTAVQQTLLAVAWVVTLTFGALLAWRLLVYAIPATRVGILTIWGRSTQGTVLKKRTERGSFLRGPRYVVTYGYWVQDKGIIRKENVEQEVFTPLVVDDEVTVIYLPRNPERAILKHALSLRWPMDVLGWGGLFALAYVGLERVRRLSARSLREAVTATEEEEADRKDQADGDPPSQQPQRAKRTPVGTA